MILQLIAEGPKHGYELIKAIEEKLGGAYTPSPGVVYPMLTMLEEMGHATVVSEGSRKLYTITEEGSKSLAVICWAGPDKRCRPTAAAACSGQRIRSSKGCRG